jgi:pilus assembly protein CpaC
MKWDKGVYHSLVQNLIQTLIALLAVVWAYPMSAGFGAESMSATTNAPTKKNKYQRSRLTSDESEGVADKRRLLLTTGEDKTVDLDFDVHMSNGINVGNPQVAGFTLAKVGEKRQLIFKPLKAGETNVTVRDPEGNIRLIFSLRVTGSNLLRVKGEVMSLLRDVEGIDIRIVGPKVVIEGDVLVPSDYGRLLTVIQDKSYADFVINMANLSPLAMQVMAKKIQDDVNSFAPNVKARVVNGMIFLEGTVDSVDQANRAVKVADLYLPDLKPGNLLEKDPSVQRHPPRQIINNFIVVNPPPARKQEKLVRVTVYFVELKKNYQKIFGFQWKPGFTADPQITFGQGQNGQAGATTSSASGSGLSFFGGTISSLIPKLSNAQSAGYARILKTGTVVVRSGQPAKLVEQTQFPFQQAGTNGQVTAASKDVGLTVGVTPLILGQSEDIQLDMDLDQTNLVGRAPAAGAPPITATHKVTTKVYVKSNESAAIAGVTATDIGTDFNIDPPESGSFEQGTSPLFNLMRSKAFRKQKSQFVIFVTPQIIENASDGTEDLKRNFRVKVK